VRQRAGLTAGWEMGGGGGQLDPKTIFIEILLMPVQLKKSLVYSSAPPLLINHSHFSLLNTLL
jgi:hypothetical protein